MKVVHSDYRPSPRTLWVVLGVMAALIFFGVVTNQAGLAAVVTTLICSGVIAWWIFRGKR